MKTHWDRASHFCGSESCHFGITDVVHGYIISTVGDYRPVYQGSNGVRQTIGASRYYETMVFRDSGRRCERNECACGGIPEAADWTELDFDGYMTESEARAGHAAMVAKYVARAPS